MPGPRILSIALAAVGVIGTSIAITLASGSGWTQLTVSELSADPAAGPVFRLTMVACGVVGLLLAAAMHRALGKVVAAGLAGPRWRWLEEAAFLAIGLGFLGTGLFALGVAPLVELAHGTSAYAIPVAGLVLMLTARLAMPALGDRFGRLSLAAIALILGLYWAAIVRLVSYAPMELAGFAIGGAWLIALAGRVERLAVPRLPLEEAAADVGHRPHATSTSLEPGPGRRESGRAGAPTAPGDQVSVGGMVADE
jgi:hypothetical protein